MTTQTTGSPPTVISQIAAGSTTSRSSSAVNLSASIGALPVGALVVASIFGGVKIFGHQVAIPNFTLNGSSTPMTMVQPSTLTTGEHVEDSLTMLAYKFITAPYANDATFAITSSTTMVGSSFPLILDMQVAVFAGVDPNGTILSNHLDLVDVSSNRPTPSVSPSVPGALLSVWYLQNGGTISGQVSYPSGPFTNSANVGPFGTFERDATVPVSLQVSSTLVDAKAGATPIQLGNVYNTTQGFLSQEVILRTAVLFMPSLLSGDSVGDLVTEG